MNVLILNGSPKKRGSTSKFLGRVMGCLLPGCKMRYASIRAKSDCASVLEQLKQIDALILAAPLYVDGIPSHVLEFLQLAEQFCLENSCHFSLYAISNNGFIEGSHNKVHLKMYECWCRRAGIAWGGGIGIGGGEMLRVLSICFPILFAVAIARNLLLYATGASPAFADWLSLLKSLGVYLFFNSGAIYCMMRLASGVRRRKTCKNRYTRVMVPSFLFVPMADIFMVLTALLNGKNIFSLLKEDHFIPE